MKEKHIIVEKNAKQKQKSRSTNEKCGGVSISSLEFWMWESFGLNILIRYSFVVVIVFSINTPYCDDFKPKPIAMQYHL